MVVVRARLTPKVGAVVLHALEAALEQVPPTADGNDVSIAPRRADALGMVAESALAGELDPGSAGDRFQVTMRVEAETLCSREAGIAAPRVSAETREMDRRTRNCSSGSGSRCGSRPPSPRPISDSPRRRPTAARRLAG